MLEVEVRSGIKREADFILNILFHFNLDMIDFHPRDENSQHKKHAYPRYLNSIFIHIQFFHP